MEQPRDQQGAYGNPRVSIIKGEIKVSKHNRVCVFFQCFCRSFRYDAEKQELICDKLGVAYPVKDGIPYLDPQEGRLLQQPTDT